MQDLVPRREGDLFKEGVSGGWRFSEEIADGVEGEPVKIKPSGRGTTNGTVKLICGTSTGKIQTTIDDGESINNGTADWDDWDKGEVTGTEMDVFTGSISAIRAVSVSGTIIFKILI